MNRFFALAAGLALALPVTLSGQTEITSRAATIRIGGRVHYQYSTSSVAAAEQDFFFRRVRFIADIKFNDFLEARVQPDFAGGETELQDVYARLNFSDRFRVSLGQFKRSFDLFELSSSTDLSLIERDGRVEGVSGCAGVGGACTYSRLTEKLGFAGRDQGIRIDGSSGRVSYEASITNGTGINVADENDAKSVAGRVTFDASEKVKVSGQLAVHDYLNPGDSVSYATGWSADVDYGGWRDGLHFQAAVSGGTNWENLDAADTPSDFLAVQAVASYYHPLAGARVVGVEPLLRVGTGDPDTAFDDDGALLVTPGVMFYFSGKNKIGANFDYYRPQGGGDSEYSLKIQTFLYF